MDAHIRKVYVPMTETAFYILLCLRAPHHGYGIVQKVEKLTDGAIRLAPGTMYGSLSKMEKDGVIIGQNIFMRASVAADDGRSIPILTMGPICIANVLKRQGYGKVLLDYSLEQAAKLGAGAVCFEGNIDFYGKSGFTYASRFGIRYHGLPEGEDASFFLCKELIPGYLDGITGEYATPSGYFVDEGEAEEFDKQFPPKEKLKLPGQLW